jgi:hypothetical protein
MNVDDKPKGHGIHPHREVMLFYDVQETILKLHFISCQMDWDFNYLSVNLMLESLSLPCSGEGVIQRVQ